MRADEVQILPVAQAEYVTSALTTTATRLVNTNDHEQGSNTWVTDGHVEVECKYSYYNAHVH